MDLESLMESLDVLTANLTGNSGPASPLYDMVKYHLGVLDEKARPHRTDPGKRIRARLCFLSCSACGGDAADATAAATAVELIHNFSLIHDDIQDRSQLRRHRPTVWSLWGEAQAINAGDLTFATAQLALAGAGATDPGRAVAGLGVLNRACSLLCEGQYLDLEFERRARVALDEYYEMIGRKTGALMEASCHLGGLYGGGTAEEVQALSDFGRCLGLAFQVQDDYLGIWGDPSVTGKPEGADILSRKKTLPLLYALTEATGESASVMQDLFRGSGPVSDDGVGSVRAALDGCDAAGYLAAEVRRWTAAAQEALGGLLRASEARQELSDLCAKLAVRTR